ncbi:MAG: FxsA family protein [Pseudomonadota bacterium]
MWLFLLLVAVPIIEIALFIEVGGWLGLWPTLAIVIATAFAGTLLLRAQGTGALGEVQRRIAEGGDPSGPLAHGAMILVAGLLLLTPGFFTDAVGFLLLTRPVRAYLIRVIAARVQVRTAGFGQTPPGATEARRPREGTVVDADYEVIDGGEDPEEPRQPERPGDPSGWTRRP